ncbi:MAG: PhzF family phenazine biosynthesis protein [Rhodobacteraceae bacterium]|nr:PhzF family phenazine biosynthesis protein [Paracoccaceae bacterium]
MLPFHTCDVFTDTPFAGNPLAIVEQADGLSTRQMQIIAREFNLSETIFVRPPDDPAHTAQVRIFVPAAEIPFAGHPTIGCAIHLARQAAGPGDFSTTITLEEGAGPVPVTVTRQGSSLWAEFTAPRCPRPMAGRISTGDLAHALGLAPAQFGPHAPGVFEGGPCFIYAPLRDRAALAAAHVVQPGWSALTTRLGCAAVYLYAPGDGVDYQARMYAPGAGIPEDPATGSASVILTGQLLANGALRDGTTTLRLLQGVEMGRPGRIGLSVDVTDGAISAIRVAGSAVPIAQGQIRPPA